MEPCSKELLTVVISVKGLEGLEAMYLQRFLEASNSLIYDGYMPARKDTIVPRLSPEV